MAVECWLLDPPKNAADFMQSHVKLYRDLVKKLDPKKTGVTDIELLNLTDETEINNEASDVIKQMQKEIVEAGLEADIDETTKITAEVERYVKDILYDAHSIEAKYNRSESRKKIEARGKRALPCIAKEIYAQFIEKPKEEWDTDLQIAFSWLLTGLIKENNLQPFPYDSKFPCVKQDPNIWIAYCEANKR